MKDVPGDKRSRRDGENNGMENVDLKRLKRHEVESLLFGDMTNYILSFWGGILCFEFQFACTVSFLRSSNSTRRTRVYLFPES